MRSTEQITAEIEGKFGFVPPFYGPAAQSPQVLENLCQQTMNAYLNNPLPSLFKEKLFAYLSRFCPVPYCIVCHSCSLHALGMQAREVLELLESPPPTETEIDEHLRLLAAQPKVLKVLSFNPVIEKSLLYCSIFISLKRESNEYCRTELRRLLGSSTYAHLVTFIAYVKTCHEWIEAHPEIVYKADKRVIDHLSALVKEEPGLADFFQNYVERVRRERQISTEQLAEIAKRKRVEEALRLSEEKFSKAFRCSADAIAISTLPDGRYIEANGSCLRLSGYSREEFIGSTATELNIWVNPEDRTRFIEMLQQQGAVHNLEHCFRLKSGEVRVGLLSAEIINLGGQQCLLSINRDITECKRAEEALLRAKVVEATNQELEKEITERKRAEQQLLHNAFHDSLTNLPNRALFMNRLRHAIAHTKTRKDYLFAVLFLDMDCFKGINDSFGHVKGDQLLIDFARRLELCLRSKDTVARLGGDEFAILLEDIKDINNATEVADRIQEILTLPFNLGGHEVFATTSIGIALSTTVYNQPEELLRDADTAMYRAKALGKARYEVFTEAMHTGTITQLPIDRD